MVNFLIQKTFVLIFSAVAVVLLAVAITAPIISFKWLYLTAGLVGVGFVALVFSNPLLALLIWVVSSPIFDFYIRIPLGAGIPDVTFTRITVVGIFFVILLQSVFKLRTLRPIGKIEKFMLAFCALAAMGIFFRGRWAENAQLLLDSYAFPFAMFYLAKNLVTSKKELKEFFYAIAILGFYLAAIGFIQYFVGVNLFTPEDFSSIHAERAHGPFNNAVEYGSVMAVAGLASFYLFTIIKKGFVKLLILMNIAIAAGAVFLSLTRAVWLSLLIAIVLILHYIPKYKKVFISCAAVALIVGAVFLLATDSSSIKERASQTGPIKSRMVLSATATKTFLSKPVLGYGFGRYSFFEASKKFITSVGTAREEMGSVLTVPHNEFLHILVMMGAVGLYIYLSIFGYSVKYSIRLYKDLDGEEIIQRNLIIFYWAILIIFIVNAFFVDMLFFSFFNSLIFLCAGIVNGYSCRRDSNQ